MTRYVQVRFWTDAFGAVRCDLMREDGSQERTKSARAVDIEDAKKWCERNGVTFVDERPAAVRVQHEAALYELEHKP
jgi:hypothetical protein